MMTFITVTNSTNLTFLHNYHTNQQQLVRRLQQTTE